MGIRRKILDFIVDIIDEELAVKARTINRLRHEVEFLKQDLDTYKIAYKTATEEISLLKEKVNAQAKIPKITIEPTVFLPVDILPAMPVYPL